MQMTTYVNFAGTCAEAFRYYERHLGGRVEMMMTHEQSPEPGRLGAEWRDKVLHARLALADTALLGADVPDAQPMRSAYLTLTVDSNDEAERIFAALADGGRVLMPIEETFFADRFGQAQDRFGINWMILRQKTMAMPPS
jgi:PhnB protein